MATFDQLMEAAAAKAIPIDQIPTDLEVTVAEAFGGDSKRRARYEGQLDEAGSVFVRAYVPTDGPMPEQVTVSDDDLRPVKAHQGVWLTDSGQFPKTAQREYDDEASGITIIVNTPPSADIETVTVTLG